MENNVREMIMKQIDEIIKDMDKGQHYSTYVIKTRLDRVKKELFAEKRKDLWKIPSGSCYGDCMTQNEIKSILQEMKSAL